MENKEKYSYTIPAGSENTAVIELKENVLGGSDALSFTSVLDELKDKGIKCIVVNCSQVKLMNSSGLGMLVGGLSHLKKFGIKMKLAVIPDKVQNLLTMTHLDKVFKTYSTMDEAVKCEE